MIGYYGRCGCSSRCSLAAARAGAQDSPQLQPRDGRAARVARSAQLAHVSAPVRLVELQPARRGSPRATSRTWRPCGRCRRARPRAIKRRRSSTTASCSSRRRSTKCSRSTPKTGDLLWRYRHQMPADIRMGHPTNRGVALYGDKVYMATSDARVVALDAKTGDVVWNKAVENYNSGYYMTIAPLAARGTHHGRRLGRRARHSRLRRRARRANRRAGLEDLHGARRPASPATTPGPATRGARAARPCGSPAASIPKLGLTYWGTGNPGPWTGDARPGDNLYTNSVVALDVETGALKAYHQYHWNDSWDWDEVSAPLLIDLPRNGRTVPGLVHAGRNGYLWMLERSATGISFIDAKPYVKQNVFTSIDPVTGRPEYDMERKPGIGKPRHLSARRSGAARTGRRRPTTRARATSTSRPTRISASTSSARTSSTGPASNSRARRRRLPRRRRRRSHRRAASLEPAHGRARVDARVRVAELGPRA